MPILVEFSADGSGARLSTCADARANLVTADEWTGAGDQGLLLAGDAEPDARFVNASLIAIDFPTFHDGRGLSLAVLLRTRLGFQGELRAVGDIRPDLLHYLRRCGFNTCVLAEGCTIAADDPVLLTPHTAYYQASVAEPTPQFRRGSTVA